MTWRSKRRYTWNSDLSRVNTRQSRLSSDIRTRQASTKAFKVLLIPGKIAQAALDAAAQVHCQV